MAFGRKFAVCNMLSVKNHWAPSKNVLAGYVIHYVTITLGMHVSQVICQLLRLLNILLRQCLSFLDRTI
jgi:hypothetical protein